MAHLRRLLVASALTTAMLCAPGWSVAEVAGITRQYHPWGRFEPGAWKFVRVVTETLNEKGEVVNTSTSDTRTVLVAVDKDGVTLEVQVTVEVAGKRFDAEPQTVKLPFHGESPAADTKTKLLDDKELTINGRTFAVHAQQIDYSGPNAGNKTTAVIHFSDTTAPFILKRETTTTDAESRSVLSETTVTVKALNMPWKAGSKIHNSAIVESACKHTKGQVDTWLVTSIDIPGGVISHASKETDKSGRLVRRSTLELLDHGLSCDEEQYNVWGRVKRRPPRYRD